jgi:DMSO/TMAO reductase YedYZ heme-binding membrane subunit
VLLKSGLLDGWNLFALITVPICAAIVTAMTRVDLSSAADISSLIQLSVRCSVPWLYLAFAATSIQSLFPGATGRWLVRNRRMLGLCFSAGMAWQLTFIVWMVTGHWNHYVDEVYLLADIVVQIPGYVFLIAMTLTSFKPVRRKMSSKQWRMLHKVGIYFLRATVWSWAPYRTIRDVVEKDPDCSTQNPMFSMVDHPGVGAYLTPGAPLQFGAMERPAPARAPLLGEHTDEVLTGVLGMSDSEIGRLHDERVGACAG